MNCQHCRPSGVVSYLDQLDLNEAHHAAGFRLTRCPGCGTPSWPWELVHEEPKPSGLRWGPGWFSNWLLKRRGFSVGCIVQWDGQWEARKYYQQKGRGVGYRIVCSGTLADCARALVKVCGGAARPVAGCAD